MDFPNKQDLIKKVQKSLGLLDDGIDGPKTWETIVDKLCPESFPMSLPLLASLDQLSPKALALILEYEVGGGKSYYDKCLKHPSYPGGESGITIGIGYDLGYNTTADFKKDWLNKLNESDFSKLISVLTFKGQNAKDKLSFVKQIEIPWGIAFSVFESNTIPRFKLETLKAFPNSDQLHPDAFGALVSLVFNRGGSVSGGNRVEMLNIRNLIASKDYAAIANEIKKMKRLWVGKGLDGLLARRDDEAKLIASCA